MILKDQDKKNKLKIRALLKRNAKADKKITSKIEKSIKVIDQKKTEIDE